ncbi:RNA-binding protein [Clostridium acetobutylicum]|uniref:Predicted RNA-binding protein containing KH domain n=1 Tax=Clostridium acetobutylicum (strain ATCC 824 / DSM 792 / JCM 1419 / IAM 19013 / LMG 5710 / NBRC 13948 / NRRL B-527 / VKM B-1787 / 2291 / W) TaxID=272562 RepID=Q97JL3_CLOAB|nr:YhbY family RNA-binding protein [Clostridium acetobutylicum]AAK79232.1 Predicted RNA-binding protein containing KH domain [Clostridium acetobutylicum ATCC 824]ADZ20312.1 RNA-binding protein containing KH domain [Clostridium acetobutylicum EA 2018]AEI34279.1 RNA-binding protein [Clostridium acetobutylicum DSM 1731]PSM04803.1 ribosome assembly RNA-binding protein YhbY [Clostridium sp. NJ4]AWV81518.1 ribosome assembly RNA-binding protein YhbY [Clostridium acetobutylicum]
MTGKQRAYLRSMANTMEVIFQIGKNGIDEAILKQLDDALEARELIKINVLESSGMTPREASDVLCEKLNCEGIQAIGKKLVIYRQSRKKPKIKLIN